MKLIKLSADHYVITDDSKIKEGDWMFLEQGTTPATRQGGIAKCKFPNADDYYEWIIWKKITHSTQPIEYTTENHLQWDKIKRLSISEVKELIGEVDVENKIEDKALERYPVWIQPNGRTLVGGVYNVDVNFSERNSYKHGYRQALEDSKDKKYTEEDMRAVFMHGFLLGIDRGDYSRDMEDRAMSHYTQPKTSWEVEFIHGKLKLK